MDYEVIWSGDVRGPNFGLLCIEGHTSKPAPMAVNVNYAAPLTAQVAAVLTEWHTIPELSAKLAVTQAAAENAIRLMRRRGLLTIALTGNRAVRKRYRLAEAA